MTAPARATYEDVVNTSPLMIAEIVDGTLYTRPIEVRHVWLVDPINLILEIYRHAGPLWHRVAAHTGNATVHAEPFEAIELPLQWLWEP